MEIVKDCLSNYYLIIEETMLKFKMLKTIRNAYKRFRQGRISYKKLKSIITKYK